MPPTEGKLVSKGLLEVHSAIKVQRGIVSAWVDPEEKAPIVGTAGWSGICDVTHALAPGER